MGGAPAERSCPWKDLPRWAGTSAARSCWGSSPPAAAAVAVPGEPSAARRLKPRVCAIKYSLM